MTDDPTTTHRRDFVRALALAGGIAALSEPAPSIAQEPPKPPDDPLAAEVEARMNLILARYGEKLDDEARQAVRKDVEATVRRGKALRAFALENGDAPCPIFRPYRAPLAQDQEGR
jgi:hypothetical protein